MRSIGTVPTVGFLVIACLALVLLCGCLPQRIKLNVVENQEAGAFCGQKDQNGKTVTYRCSDSLVCMNGTCSTGTDTTNVDPGDGDQGYETTAPSDSVNEHDIDNPDDLIIDAGLDSSPTVDSDSGTDLSVELDQLDAMDDLDALFLSDSGVDTYDTEIVPPIVTIESSPPALTADLQATFTFSCQQTSCTFECALDGGDWVACVSPYTVSATHGEHALSIRAKTTEGTFGPTKVTPKWKFVGWKSVSSGRDHVCAISLDGERWCWGRGSGGKLGIVGAPSPVAWPTRYDEEMTVWRVVASAEEHTCAIDTGFQVWCWGASSESGIDENTGVQSLPKLIDTTSGPSAYQQITSSHSHTCGRGGDGTLWCWGGNDFEQIGPNSINTLVPYNIVVEGYVYVWLDVSTGYAHTCAISSPESWMYCWGANWYGQLGIGGNAKRNTPTKLGEKKWLHVALGDSHSCAISDAMQLWCWGLNDKGQLGVNDTDPRDIPTKIDTGSTTWKAIATSVSHTCAIDSASELWCWGANEFGQLSFDDKKNRTFPSKVIGGPQHWSIVSPGATFTCAIAEDSSLWCWGNDSNEELGNGTDGDHIQPMLIKFKGE